MRKVTIEERWVAPYLRKTREDYAKGGGGYFLAGNLTNKIIILLNIFILKQTNVTFKLNKTKVLALLEGTF
jgi:hypothetical protein